MDVAVNKMGGKILFFMERTFLWRIQIIKKLKIIKMKICYFNV